jgi:hypothetical protein
MVMMGIEGDVLPSSGESGRTHGPINLLFLSDTFIAYAQNIPINPHHHHHLGMSNRALASSQ